MRYSVYCKEWNHGPVPAGGVGIMIIPVAMSVYVDEEEPYR